MNPDLVHRLSWSPNRHLNNLRRWCGERGSKSSFGGQKGSIVWKRAIFVPSFDTQKLSSCFFFVCCRDLGWNGSNNKHSFEEQTVHLPTFTPSILAPVQLARPGWLPRQAKPPLLRGLHGTSNKSHWPWNVKSTMRKARSSPTQTWIPLGKLQATYNFAA